MKEAKIIRSNLIHFISLYFMNEFYVVHAHVSEGKNFLQFLSDPFQNLIVAPLFLTLFEAVFILVFFISIVCFDIVFFNKFIKKMKIFFLVETISVYVVLSFIILSFYPNLVISMLIFGSFFSFSQYLRYLIIKAAEEGSALQSSM